METTEQFKMDISLAKKLADSKNDEVIEGYTIVSNIPLTIQNDVTFYEIIVFKEGKYLKSRYTISFRGKDPLHTPFTKEPPVFLQINL